LKSVSSGSGLAFFAIFLSQSAIAADGYGVAATSDICTVSGNPFSDKLTRRQHAVMPGDRANGALNPCGIGKPKFPNGRGKLPRLYTPERPGVTGEREQSLARILGGP
jgi:hypothetical protein